MLNQKCALLQENSNILHSHACLEFSVDRLMVLQPLEIPNHSSHCYTAQNDRTHALKHFTCLYKNKHGKH